MIAFKPESETLLVLEQAGFPRNEIETALTEYKDLVEKYPDLVNPSCKDFTLFLKTRFRKSANDVANNMNGSDLWVPSIAEIAKLEQEGYWREIISNALIDHLTSRGGRKGAISKFAIFRSYLREKLLLDFIDSANWYPNAYLIALVRNELQIGEQAYTSFWGHFIDLAAKREIEGRFVPRYFYNFVKKNRDRIIRMSQFSLSMTMNEYRHQNIRRIVAVR